jgi:hypothetical protein
MGLRILNLMLLVVPVMDSWPNSLSMVMIFTPKMTKGGSLTLMGMLAAFG